VKAHKRGRLLTPARPTPTHAGASEKSLPGPAGAALRQPQRTFLTILRAVPEALDERRPAAVVKRSLLDDGEVRRSIARR